VAFLALILIVFVPAIFGIGLFVLGACKFVQIQLNPKYKGSYTKKGCTTLLIIGIAFLLLAKYMLGAF